MGGVGSGGNHGGGRPKGKKAKPKVSEATQAAGQLTHEVARKLYLDQTTEHRWRKLRDHKDAWLRFHVEKEISHQAAGKPRESMEIKGDVNLNLDARKQRVVALLARLAGKAR